MEQPKGRVNLTILLLPFVFVALSALLLYGWYTEVQLYNGAKLISAVISRCSMDIDDDKEYDVYVDYTFDGNNYMDVYWRTFQKRQQIGQTVTVRVNSVKPDRVINYPTGIGTTGIAIGVIGIGMVFKVMPMAFDPKYRHVRRAEGEKPAGKSPILPFAIGLGVLAVAFILMGIFFSLFFHIGSIICAFITISMIDLLIG